MEKKNLDWANLGFGYVKTDKRFVANYKDGAWDDGVITDDDKVVLNECAGVLQYAQTCFEGLKAYTTEDGHIVMFRPDLNAQRMHDSCERLEMPPFPVDKFVQAVTDTVKANAAWVPPFGSGATLYIRPYMFGSNPVIGVKPADEYQFRILTTPVGPYFKGGAKPLTIKVSDFDRAAPHGTGHIKAGLNYAMSLHAIVTAHKEVTLEEVKDFAECGLCGTAAVISPVGKIVDHGKEICMPSGMEKMGPTIQKLYDTLTGIQMGKLEAPKGWIYTVE